MDGDRKRDLHREEAGDGLLPSRHDRHEGRRLRGDSDGEGTGDKHGGGRRRGRQEPVPHGGIRKGHLDRNRRG